MVSTEDIVEAFDDLGYTLEDPKVIDRLCSLCDEYGVDENKVSCEYLAFANKKKYQAPTSDILDLFDLEVLKGLQSSNKENSKRVVLDSTNIQSWVDDEDDVLGRYGTPKSAVGAQSKRQITPDSGIHKRRLGVNIANQTLSPDTNQIHTPTGKKYAARDNAGKVLIRHGDNVNPGFWSNASDYYRPEIKPFDQKKEFSKDYRFMFERLREKAGFLDETICRLGDVLQQKHELEEPIGFGPPMNEPFPSLGRICCDSEGRLNANSLLLQGTQDLSRGHALSLDVSQIKEYSIFPGQVVHSTLTNPSGSKLIAHSIVSEATPQMAPFQTKLGGNDTLHIVVACGPFTTNDNLAYEPFKDLLDYIGKNRPHVVILCGPFVDSKQSLIDQCETDGLSYEEIFNKLIKTLEELLQDLPMTQVILQPSTRDVHHKFIFPTPEFKIEVSPRIVCVPDPAMISIDGVIFGVTSTDILFHLGKEEICYPPRSGDRIRRLATHLLQQRSFYPLYPQSEEMNIDFEQLELLGQIEVQPHVLITPSDLMHFFKDVEGGLVINPQRLAKGAGGGVFARLAVQGGTKEVKPSKKIVGEIVRI